MAYGTRDYERNKNRGKGKQRRMLQQNPDLLDEAAKERARKQKEWMKKKGYISESDSEYSYYSDEEGEGEGDSGYSYYSEDDGIDAARAAQPVIQREKKKKGVEGLIEIENPNYQREKVVKAKDIGSSTATKTKLSRREREELEKQRAQQVYWERTARGETSEAKKDLARLAEIRRKREKAKAEREAAEKLEAERAAIEAEKRDKALNGE